MNQAQFNGMWDNVKGEIKHQWGELTDSDIKKIGGNKDKLLASIEKKYGYAKKKAQDELDEFLNKMDHISKNNSIEEKIRHVGYGVKDFGHKIVEKSEHLSEAALEKMDENYKQAVTYVKKNPVKSVCIGVGLGLLVGKLLK